MHGLCLVLPPQLREHLAARRSLVKKYMRAFANVFVPFSVPTFLREIISLWSSLTALQLQEGKGVSDYEEQD